MVLFVYLLVGISSFFLVIVPISGGIVLNPLLSLIVDPHTAISVTVFFFMINSGIKAIIFRNDIMLKYVIEMLPVSIVAAIIGTYVVGLFSETFLYVLMFLMTLFFASKKLFPALFKSSGSVEKTHSGSIITSLMSGFMQGVGLGGGGSLRKIYFLSNNLSLQQMHGTTSALSVMLGTVSTFIRLETDQVTTEILLPVLYLIPIMVVSIIYGKKILIKLSDRTSDVIIKITLSLTLLFVAFKLI